MQRSLLLLLVTVITVLPSAGFAQRRGSKAKRVAPPKFDESQTKEYFFTDVFSILVGDRPNLNKTARPQQGGGAAPSDNGGTVVKGWAAAISGEALENEVKAIKISLDQTITNPGAFRGRGYQECRREFTVAAMVFGIISEFDGDVRFKENSSGFRDALARTGRNCKVGTIQAYNESKQRKADLQDVLSGSAYQGKEGDPDATWDKICDRSPLMQRLEISLDKHLKPGTSSAAEFNKNLDTLSHEAQLVAAMALVLMKEGMEDGDYEDYQEFCNQMKQGAADIVSGVKQKNYESARKGAGIIGQACSTCHENYRG